MTERVEPRILKGFRDYLPELMSARERMLATVARVFQSFGFQPLATPALEYTEILLGKYGTEGDQLLYRFRDNGGRDVALRYDLTIPLARVMGQHGGQLPKPFRRYQIAPVWRADKPGRGRFREFVQCDVDIVGSDSLLADFECMQVGVAVLRGLGVKNFQIRVNDRRILDGLMRRLGISDSGVQTEVLRTMDKLPKIGWEAMTRELLTKAPLDSGQLTALKTFLETTDLTAISEVVDLSVAQPGIDALTQMLAWAETLGIDEHLAVDLSIARGLDYYTSTVYETFLTDLDGFGAVMSGGRYDGLLSLFSKQDQPAVGISLGVDRLLAGLIELGLVTGDAAPADVFVALMRPEDTGYSQKVAVTLREAGLRVQTRLGSSKKLGKQFSQADKLGIPVVVVAGEAEQAADEVTLKHMPTGEQLKIKTAEAAAQIKLWQTKV